MLFTNYINGQMDKNILKNTNIGLTDVLAKSFKSLCHIPEQCNHLLDKGEFMRKRPDIFEPVIDEGLRTITMRVIDFDKYESFNESFQNIREANQIIAEYQERRA